MKLASIVIALLLAAWLFLTGAPVSRAQKETPFPTDDEIQLLLTQADRAMQQYKPLIDEEERQLGKNATDAVAKDRQVVQAVELAVKAFKKHPQGFNGPLGFSFNEWLDDATRNALLCSQTAMSQSTTSMMAGKTADALEFVQLSKSCMDASNLIYTVSENVGALYERYVKAEEELANEGADVAQKCTDALKKMAAEKKQ
jgi:hypothetical protein